jgi:hypothetical protein
MTGVSATSVTIGVGAAALLVLVAGLILYGGKKRIPGLAGKEIDLIALLVAMTALVASVFIPEKINADNNARQADATCYSSLMSIRKALNTIEQGYTVAPEERDQRRADWESLRAELENGLFGCHDVHLPEESNGQLRQLTAGLDAAKAASDRPDPDKDYFDRVKDWTTSALQQLNSAR